MWKTQKSRNWENNWFGYLITAAGSYEVAGVTYTADKEETAKNARLMAAAPKFLAAQSGALDMLYEAEPNCDWFSKDDMQNMRELVASLE